MMAYLLEDRSFTGYRMAGHITKVLYGTLNCDMGTRIKNWYNGVQDRRNTNET